MANERIIFIIHKEIVLWGKFHQLCVDNILLGCSWICQPQWKANFNTRGIFVKIWKMFSLYEVINCFVVNYLREINNSKHRYNIWLHKYQQKTTHIQRELYPVNPWYFSSGHIRWMGQEIIYMLHCEVY